LSTVTVHRPVGDDVVTADCLWRHARGGAAHRSVPADVATGRCPGV